MKKQQLSSFYNECLNTDLSTMLELISDTNSENEKEFYIELYNFILRTRQKECIANGKF